MVKERRFHLIIRTDEELKTFLKFKAMCAAKDSNVTREVIKIMKKYVNGEIK